MITPAATLQSPDLARRPCCGGAGPARRLRPARTTARASAACCARRGPDDARAAADQQPHGAGARVQRGRHVARLPLQRHGATRTRPIISRLAAGRFADWRLTVDGLVRRPLSLSLDQIRRMPRAHPDHPPRLRRGLVGDRQMDRRAALAAARPGGAACTTARYIVFHCCRPLRRPRLIMRAST